MGLFGAGPGPTDLEIMGEMISDQTKQIQNMIDSQTDVLLEASQNQLDAIDAQTTILTNEIRDSTRKISLEMMYQMLDDMQGISYALGGLHVLYLMAVGSHDLYQVYAKTYIA